MLIGFSVSNFKSFKNSQSFSMLASRVSRHKDHIVNIGKKRILKSGVIFGANAGGKSNFIKAIDFSKKIVLYGISQVNTNKQYFRIDDKSYRTPGVFEYRVIIDNYEYSYGFAISYEKKEIISEWLYRIENLEKEICIFNREQNESGENIVNSDLNEDDFANSRFRIYLDDFEGSISETFKKKTILSDIAERSNDKTGVYNEISKLFNWFKGVTVIYPSSKIRGLDEYLSNDNKKDLFSSILSSFDTGIESVETSEQEMDFDKMLRDIPKEIAEKIKVDLSNEVNETPIVFRFYGQMVTLKRDNKGNIVFNKMKFDHGNRKDLFDYDDESDGTKRLFDLIPLFFERKKMSAIFIDEIDRSLHTNLIKMFLHLYYSLSDKCKCQLIATSHDTNLLDLDLLRQDEIWFIKRENDHSSSLYSLNRYRERFDKKIDKEYLLGRYQAVPNFGHFADLEGVLSE